MNKKPDITVVIPNYNSGKFLPGAIDSVLNQEGIQVEVIVVDDGSTDNSREVLEGYKKRIIVHYQENKGAPAARNLGWKISDAAYIKFLDSDDVLLPGVLKQQLDQMDQLDKKVIPYGDVIWTDENLNPIQGYPVMPRMSGQHPVYHILTQNPLTSAPLHRKELLERVGGFDEELVKGQEYDLHLRLVLKGVEFRSMSMPIYYFRQSQNPHKISNLSIGKYHKKIYSGLNKQEHLIKDYFNSLIPLEVRNYLATRYLEFGKVIIPQKTGQ